MKDFLVIIRRNFVSPTVIAILVLALILAILSEYRDALFLSSVIVINTLIGVVQETRARMALKKLELMNAPRAHRLRSDDTVEDVMFDQLKVGDTVKLKLGDEIPADGEIIDSAGFEVDESILTGESASVEKQKRSVAYAATFVVAGNALMIVKAIGPDTKAGSMAKTLRLYSPRLTPLQRDINRAINWLTYGALGLALLIFIVYSFSGQDATRIFKTITSGAVTVIPEGLLLASSVLLAFGSLRLVRVKVLPQKLSAIEAMALLEILCVDKTGTLTSDKISFDNMELFDDSVKNLPELIGIVAKETNSGSSTGNAIIAAFDLPSGYRIIQTLAFSSERKVSGVKVVYNNKTYTILVGAPEFLGDLTNLSLANQKRIESLASVGKRVLLVGMFDDVGKSIDDLPKKSGRAMSIIILSNKLRIGVRKTVNYLQNNGVNLRVISGDNPNTVQYVAQQAGISRYQDVLTGSELQSIPEKDWDNLVANTTIFARVLPEQKEKLIATFKKSGKFTGMVGDGVNDALALKKSDFGVAMYAGAPATRRVADAVLLNNSFNALPMGMRLGNRIMQAIELIATLFFHKIIYGVVLLLSTMVLGIVYPFEPRHITFMNIFLVTMPTLMWTFFTPYPLHRLSPRHFWKDTLLAVAPIAALSGMVAAITYSMLLALHPNDPSGVSTTTVIIAIFFGVYLVFLVPRMFAVADSRKSRSATLLYVTIVVAILLPSFGIGFVRDFFDFTTPAWRDTLPLLLVIVTTAILQWEIAGNAGRRLKRRNPGATKR